MDFEISKVYTFNTLAPLFLGSKIEHATFKGKVDAALARRLAPIDQLHAQIHPTLPAGSPVSADASEYYVFKGQNNSEIVMASAWIDMSSIAVISYVNINISITNGSLADVEKARMALSAAGLYDFVITTNP